jgi:hypothetical protein
MNCNTASFLGIMHLVLSVFSLIVGGFTFERELNWAFLTPFIYYHAIGMAIMIAMSFAQMAAIGSGIASVEKGFDGWFKEDTEGVKNGVLGIKLKPSTMILFSFAGGLFVAIFISSVAVKLIKSMDKFESKKNPIVNAKKETK